MVGIDCIYSAVCVLCCAGQPLSPAGKACGVVAHQLCWDSATVATSTKLLRLATMSARMFIISRCGCVPTAAQEGL